MSSKKVYPSTKKFLPLLLTSPRLKKRKVGSISRFEGSGKVKEGFLNSPCCAGASFSLFPGSSPPPEQTKRRWKAYAWRPGDTGCSSSYTPSLMEGTVMTVGLASASLPDDPSLTGAVPRGENAGCSSSMATTSRVMSSTSAAPGSRKVGCSSSAAEGTTTARVSRRSTPAGDDVGCSSSKTEGTTVDPLLLGRGKRRLFRTLLAHWTVHFSYCVGLLTHAQWCTRHSGSRAAFSAAFQLCTLHGVAAPVVSSLVHARQSNNTCWLEHGHPVYGGTKTSSTSTGSGVGRSPAGNGCAPVLSHSPSGTSRKMHDRAGVRDVSLPENPISRYLVGPSWLTEADVRGINVSRLCWTLWPLALRADGGLKLLEGSASGAPGWGWGVGVLVLESGHGKV